MDFGHSGVIEGYQSRELILMLHWQMEVTREPRNKGWYRGRFGLRAEPTVIINFEPRFGHAGGLGLLLRYTFQAHEHFQPWFQVGAGFLGLDLDIADQADGFAFMPQLGFGLNYRINRHHSVDLGFRYHHISNAFTQDPNGGIDTCQLLLGYGYHF